MAQRDLIDQAVEGLGRSRSDFILEASCSRSKDVLLDQLYFQGLYLINRADVSTCSAR